MTTLDKISWPAGSDDARVWAAIREMELRRPRYEVARRGFLGIVRQATAVFREMAVTLRGLDEVV